MDTVYIVLIVASAVVLLVIAWMYRDRLTEGFFRGTKDGVEASLKAAAPDKRREKATDTPEAREASKAGVYISGELQGAKISRMAGRDIVKGTQGQRTGGQAPGIIIEDGDFTDMEIQDVAGRDLINGDDTD